MTKQHQAVKCVVYKGSAKPDTYLYVLKADDFSDVPETLINAFGQTEKVMALTLTPEHRLARDNTQQVMHDLTTQGYHLQLPPPDPLISPS